MRRLVTTTCCLIRGRLIQGRLIRGLLCLALAAVAWPGSAGAVPAQDPGSQVLATLLSFNLRTSSADDGANAWERRKSLAARVVTSREPDIAGFQEAQPDQVAFLVSKLPGYRHLGRSREAQADAGEAVPIFYHAGRWSLDPAEHGTFWLSDTPEVPGSRTWGNHYPRIVTWARLVHRATDTALYVYNLHFDHESENARLNGSQLLSQRIAARRYPDPVVVLGDFNAEPGSPVLATLLGAENGLVDTMAGSRGAGTFHDFTGQREGRRIDFILVSPQFEVRNAGILYDASGSRYPSDHFPVIATIGF